MWMLFWLWALLSDPPNDNEIEQVAQFFTDVISIFKPLIYLSLLLMTSFGVYVFFNGLFGYQFTGYYKVMLGIIIFPMAFYWLIWIITKIMQYVLRGL